MDNYVIVVNYKVKPEHLENFIELLREISINSLEEPGCLNYEASIDGNKIFLYEKYKTKEDFNFHITQAYFKKYMKNTNDMVIDKVVKKFISL